MLGRRSFLTQLAGLAATAVLDPERLLWVPGQKTIFVFVPPHPHAGTSERGIFCGECLEVHLIGFDIDRWTMPELTTERDAFIKEVEERFGKGSAVVEGWS